MDPLLPFHCMHVVHSKNTDIEACAARERKHKEGSAHKHCVSIDPSVHACWSQHGWYITEEIISVPGLAIRDVECICNVGTGIDRAHYPRFHDHQHTHSFTYMNEIEEWNTNSHRVAIGHRRQEKNFSKCKSKKKKL